MMSHSHYLMKQALYSLVLILIVIIPGSIPIGSAEVGFSCRVYNSADSASEAVSGENLNFDGAALLENDLVTMEGKGSTISNQSYYSYELVCKEDHMQSAARTDSGQLAWGGRATAGYNSSVASLYSKAYISDGNYTAFYKNSDLAVSENVWALGSKFQEIASIFPHSLSSQGIGATDEASEGIRGTDQTLLVEGFGRWLRIDSEVMGKTSLQWMSGVDSSQSGYSLKMMMAGISDDESGIERMEMIGSGEGFPLQVLPPGRMNVNRLLEVNPNSTIDSQFIEKEIADFNRENSLNNSLSHWYNLNQSSIVNLTGITSGGEWNMTPGVRFKMKMALELDRAPLPYAAILLLLKVAAPGLG